jgi:hypothetical protein
MIDESVEHLPVIRMSCGDWMLELAYGQLESLILAQNERWRHA